MKYELFLRVDRVFGRRRRMKGGNDGDKEIKPMFPRLHIKDAEKGGPKTPPRNKMALYEQFGIPSQSFASGSASLFSLPLKNNCSLPSVSGHVDSSQRIQFCNSSSPSYLAHKIHGDHSIGINLNNSIVSGSPLSCMNSLQKYGEDYFISDSAHGRKFSCGIIRNNKNKNKFAHLESSCSLKSQNSFLKKINSNGSIEMESGQNGKKQIEKHSEVNRIGQKPKEGYSQPFAGFGDMIDASSVSSLKIRNSKSMNKAHEPLMVGIGSTLVDSSKILQSTDSQTHKGHADLGDKISLPEGSSLKPVLSDVRNYPNGLESGKKCINGETDKHKAANMNGICDPSNKSTTNSIFRMDISPDEVLGVLGVQHYLKARTTIVKQQRIFLVQVFELHRLIKVQKLIAGSLHLLLEDNLSLNKPSLKVSSLKNLQSEFVTDQPPSIMKRNREAEKPTTAEQAEHFAAEKILVPCVDNNASEAPLNQLSDHGHHSGITPLALATPRNEHSPLYNYQPSGNQWLVPIMSPSEGLVYRPFAGPCPPSACFVAPLYGACGLMSLNPASKDTSDAPSVLGSHQGVGILSGTPLPHFYPPHGPPVMHLSASSAAEQKSPLTKMQSNVPENHQSAGEINSTIVYQSSCNMSNQTSQVMSTNVANYHSSKDKELHRSMGNSPSKKMKVDALPLFPIAPTVWELADQNVRVVDHQPRVIRAQPHNRRSATESAARIFKLIQEERKHL